MRTTEEFWSRVDKAGECWLWTGARSTLNYGNCWWRGRYVHAHRLAWTLYFGEIPPAAQVNHRCDNPPCVNPTHLFLGSQLDNVRDMVRKGRAQKIQASNPKRRLSVARYWGSLTIEQREQRGRRSQRRPLTKQLADRIRILAATKSTTELARQFDVSKATISAVRIGKTWK